MASTHLRSLTIDFIDDKPDGLRRVTQSNWAVECLIASRRGLPKTLDNSVGRNELDVPGVYLLVGPTESADDEGSCGVRLYVGQADSVADRLDQHLRDGSKKWWRTVAAIRRPEQSPLNLSQCKFIESRLCDLASKARRSILANKNAPQPAFLAPNEASSAEEFLDKGLVILAALGLDFFDSQIDQKSEPAAEPTEPRPLSLPIAPSVPGNVQPLLDAIKEITSGSSFPNAEWYWSRVPDYRVKVVRDGDFRVFVRILWAKNWLWVGLKDVGRFKVSTVADIAKLHEKIQNAYEKADQYLQRGK